LESYGKVATSAGLPLTVALEGTISIDVSARGRVEFGSLFGHFDPRVDIRGTL